MNTELVEIYEIILRKKIKCFEDFHRLIENVKKDRRMKHKSVKELCKRLTGKRGKNLKECYERLTWFPTTFILSEAL